MKSTFAIVSLVLLLAVFSDSTTARVIYIEGYQALYIPREFANETTQTIKQTNIIEAPIICPPGYDVDHTNKCRKVWS